MKGTIRNNYSTFSGADSLAFMLLPNTPPILMGTLTTVSYSMYRDKKPVTLIGRINTAGFTRGSRVCAGTMIFTMINKHWINELTEQVPWLKKYGKMKADELPIFDVMIISANEYGAAVNMFILGIDFTDEGQVLSVEDMFTENQFSFIARDVDVFDEYTNMKQNDKVVPHTVTRVYNMDNIYNNKITDYRVFIKKPIPIITLASVDIPIKSNLIKNTSNMISNEDVSAIQTLLNIPPTGTYDTNTYDKVKEFQSENGLPITGALDDNTYNILAGNVTSSSVSGKISYKDGAPVYETTDLEKLLKTLPYNEDVKILNNSNGWMQTEHGYIPSNYVYAYDNNPSNYPELRFGDTGENVLILQKILNIINNASEDIGLTLTSIFDYETLLVVKEYQVDNKMYSDGIVNVETWNNFKTKVPYLSPDTIMSGYGYTEEFITIPKSYVTPSNTIDDNQYGVIIHDITKESYIKVSSIMYYSNGLTKTLSKTLKILESDDERSITLNELQGSLLFDMEYESMPEHIEFIIYSEGNSPYKWNINIDN